MISSMSLSSSGSVGGDASSTRWPSDSQRCAAATTDFLTSISTFPPKKFLVDSAMRNPLRGRSTDCRNGTAGGGAKYRHPGSGPAVASSAAAESRTLRVNTCDAVKPLLPSAISGPTGLRPRVGFNPNTPQQCAGTRMEPPVSPPSAIGTAPDATAAAAPPLEPPGERARFHGLRVGPLVRGSVV